jgi:hypothetical protein
MHWADWRWKAPDGTWVDVPELYRRCAAVVECGRPRGKGFSPTNAAASIVMFGDNEHDLAPALWVPMKRFWEYYTDPWESLSAAAAFRALADQLDDEVPPERRRRPS